MEEIRKVKITLEIETNKQTIKKSFDDIGEAVDFYDDFCWDLEMLK